MIALLACHKYTKMFVYGNETGNLTINVNVESFVKCRNYPVPTNGSEMGG